MKTLEKKVMEERNKLFMEVVANPERWLTELQYQNVKSGKKDIEFYKANIEKKLAKKYKLFYGFETILERNTDIDLIEIKIKEIGCQVKSTVTVSWSDGTEIASRTYTGAKTSGSGYDKDSTSVADALNQTGLLTKLFEKEETELKNSNYNRRDFLGYGSGYGILPYFEGGVGMYSLIKIIEKLGFKCISNRNGYISMEKK